MLWSIAVLVLGGFGRRMVRSFGLTPRTACAWCAIWASGSVLNLTLPPIPHVGWEPLLNPGGTLLPLAASLWLWGGMGRLRRATVGAPPDVWALLLGVLGGVSLALAVAWEAGAGLEWPGAGLALLLGAVFGLGRDGVARSPAFSGAVACGCCAWTGLVLALCGWSPWPPAIGGGQDFNVGIITLLAAAIASQMHLSRRVNRATTAGAG